jgi:hypothetical protein
MLSPQTGSGQRHSLEHLRPSGQDDPGGSHCSVETLIAPSPQPGVALLVGVTVRVLVAVALGSGVADGDGVAVATGRGVGVGEKWSPSDASTRSRSRTSISPSMLTSAAWQVATRFGFRPRHRVTAMTSRISTRPSELTSGLSAGDLDDVRPTNVDADGNVTSGHSGGRHADPHRFSCFTKARANLNVHRVVSRPPAVRIAVSSALSRHKRYFSSALSLFCSHLLVAVSAASAVAVPSHSVIAPVSNMMTRIKILTKSLRGAAPSRRRSRYLPGKRHVPGTQPRRAEPAACCW